MRVKVADIFKLILFLAVFCFAIPTVQKQSSQTKKALPVAQKPKPNLNLETISQSTAIVVSGSEGNISFGSGFFISSSLLVTNSHAVENAIRIDVL